MIELYILIALLVGLATGTLIMRNAIRERDETIEKLNKRIDELTESVDTFQRVCNSNNGTITRLRRENEMLKKKR